MRKEAVCVTAMPTSYRERIYEIVSSRRAGDFHVIYCHEREPNRQWDVQLGDYSKSFLKKSYFPLGDVFVHVNADVWAELNHLDPQVVITTGYNPTFLFAYAWCLLKGRKHIPFTDGWLKSEEDLTQVHFWTRRAVFWRSCAFLGASRHSLELFRHYGCPEVALFQSHLCADNARYRDFAAAEKKYDVMFSGQFIERKMPFFFAEVAKHLKLKLPGLRVLLLGDGPEREALLADLRAAEIDFHYAGYVSQAALPTYYAAAKILLFPTKLDPWGIVANEACAVGVPVITCANAGVAGDLILHGYNGYILELDATLWCEYALQLLRDPARWQAFSEHALDRVQDYNYDVAADGIIKALKFCEDAT